jgi:hypothetical protein
MAWGGSAVFAAFTAAAAVPDERMRGGFAPEVVGGVRFALFDSSVTPDRTAAAVATRYGFGTWLPGREVSHPPSGWNAGGGGTLMQFIGGNPDGRAGLQSSGLGPRGGTVLADLCGDLMYFAVGAAAPQGIAFHDYGGSVDVNGGTLGITWAGYVILLNVGAP